MRIVHVINYFHPQIGYQETFLAREHADAGHDVFVVTSDRYHPSLYAGNAAPIMGKRIKGAGFFLENHVQVWRLKTGFEFPNLIWLVGLEKKIREIMPDLVIVHGITSITAVRCALLKNRLGGFSLIYDDHATPDNTMGKMRVLYPLFRWTLSGTIQKAADALVAIVPATRDFMREKYGIPPERITVIPLGADARLFRFDGEARREVRRKHRIPAGNIVFIYASKIIRFRQVTVFLQAVAGLMDEREDISVLMIGSGEEQYISELKEYVKSRGLDDRFTWLDEMPNDQLYRYYSAADVSVWPFAASIGMREAMSCGLPIIIGEKSLVTELVENDNGFLFREGDVSDLVGKMRKLLDADLRKEMGQRGRALVEDKLSWKVIAGQFLDLVGKGT